MCVAVLAWNIHPTWHLIAIANRDELHARPADPLHRWKDRDIIAGRDRESGGTWLGVGSAGTPEWRFALVTNLRGYERVSGSPRSRGRLVTDCLRGPQALPQEQYNPFNLATGDARSLTIMTNRPVLRADDVESGFRALSNGSMGEIWPKSEFLKAALAACIQTGSDETAPLFHALSQRVLPTNTQFESTASANDSMTTQPFILNPIYGTRCSTVCAIDTKGNGFIAERRFDAHGIPTGETTISFP